MAQSSAPSSRSGLICGAQKRSIPSAVSMRLDRLDPLCMPLTIPEGGRSIVAGRAEEEDVEVVAVTSGGTEKFSRRGRKIEI